MALKCSLIVFFVFTVVVTLADDVGPQPPITVIPPVNISTPEPPPTPTPTPEPTAAPTTKPTPAPPTTAKPTATPTTTKPTATPTTTKPTATPTTTKPTATPTTSKPTTAPTTTIAPITTPAPTPVEKPDWFVNGTNNTVCIVAHMNIKLDIPFKTTQNESKIASFKLEHVGDASATGVCGNDSQTLNLIWNNKNINTTFVFTQNATANSYNLSSVQISVLVNNNTFPNIAGIGNATNIVLTDDKEVFSRKLDNSYTCSNVAPLNLNGSEHMSGTLTLTNAHVQAFGQKNTTAYRAAVDCAPSVLTPDIVPIVVGLILAGLVVCVLIAYLVGRHRAQSRGYVSM